MTDRILLFALAGLLALCAIFPALLGWAAIRNLWADYRDSPPSTYLLVGGLSWLLAFIVLVAAVLSVRKAVHSK